MDVREGLEILELPFVDVSAPFVTPSIKIGLFVDVFSYYLQKQNAH